MCVYIHVYLPLHPSVTPFIFKHFKITYKMEIDGLCWFLFRAVRNVSKMYVFQFYLDFTVLFL